MKMGNLDLLVLLLFSIFFFSTSHLTCAATTTNVSSTCPMDLNYVLRIPWNRTLCQNYRPPAQQDNSSTQNSPNNQQTCCFTVRSLFGVGLAQHLKETSQFHLSDLNTSVACLQDLQSKLSSLSLADNLVSYCLDPSEYVISPKVCAGIETYQGWVGQLGKSTALDSACRPDLTDLTACGACVAAGYKVQSTLVSIDGNQTRATDCFYFAVLYAAAFANQYGPESDGAVSCIFGLDLNSNVGSSGKTHSGLVIGLTGAGVAVVVMSSLLGLYFWYDKKRGRKKRPGFGFDDDEEQGSRPKLRPNAGSIWFKIQDLVKATDNFSQKNFIGRGGFGFVYKGTLADGTTVAIKRIIESDFQGNAEFCNEVEIISNLKHRNLVPLRGCCVIDEDDDNYDDKGSQRPTILEALKMLEGDIEVPSIPDRPMPLGHPSFYADGNTFSTSPALSGPKLCSGDMLR
ncbi:hypothetical protein Tsubulata_030781 [Turnera subulata]|uniref:non-specific serine/threonine protein kinase n=1 Tax=Turnera subulata TaxID=218843 RepID=A0A9Q0FL34_9ROSI|nr:hypothetical protein Tsubulata_030781 [Turnera subulata]